MNDSRSGFGSLHMPRSRGAVSGLLLIILGAWGALIPFIGPYFHFAYTPDQAWAWSTARAWLEVFPGVTTAVGGFLLLVSGNRATAMFGGWLAVIAGAWFVVGRTLASLLRLGDIGHPIAVTDAKRAQERCPALQAHLLQVQRHRLVRRQTQPSLGDRGRGRQGEADHVRRRLERYRPAVVARRLAHRLCVRPIRPRVR